MYLQLASKFEYCNLAKTVMYTSASTENWIGAWRGGIPSNFKFWVPFAGL